ncbi:hypothetical protein JAAARDRAFT_32946 [Jaapia argillacea MUCL 33604]|uniref:Uncharacterized protein n=1 Tax=Jaapia argillacea MUCL 33604 TaxID=933084 RepID=A0A067PZT6_9AGAM|nr:hypothetical protein JAAARDRAFT_32946 [Jaapia argillacea MUCL 33604]
MDNSREDLPRVSVDTLQDWQRVRANYEAAILHKLEERLATSPSSHDRQALLGHVNQFINSTFDIARPNLRVNGRNFEDVDEHEEDMEPFDEGLDRRIWSLSDQRLKLDHDIGNKRRSTPKDVEKLMQELLKSQREVDDELAAAIVDANHDELGNADVVDDRYPEMESTFRQTSALSEELSQAVPVQQERSKRIKNVDNEIKSLQP